MNEHVSSDTAILLIDAGFPQPLPDFGQVWHSNSGELCLIGHKDPNVRLFRLHEPERVYHVGGKICDIAIFAPTATDILKELGRDYALLFDEDMKQWGVLKHIGGMEYAFIHWDDTPAQAASVAYLAKNK